MGKFFIKKTNTGFTFRLKAGNGETIAVSEVYESKKACDNGIRSVMKNAPVANVEDQTVKDYETVKHPKFVIYKDKRNKFRFNLRATNGEIIAASEAYTTKANCKNGINSVKKNSVDAQIIEED
ncbi:MAG: YegP family protein [Oscillospiraceae bacterium]|nr:YegP family protein [Oscillospiraceae bacterium]